MKHGQITLFIIIGIVILSIFIFLFSVLSSVSEERLERQREQAVSSALDTSVIQRYASVCVDNALENGLQLLGYQGGVLFEGQLGGVITPDHVRFGEWDVSFGIVPRTLEPPYLYPCLEQFAELPPAFCHYPDTLSVIGFGQSRLLMLEGSVSGGVLSVQKQLERYIAEYVRRCVDIDQLSETEGLQAYSIEEGAPTAEVLFQNRNVVAKVNYPLSVSVGGEEPITQFVYFETQLPVRFRHIYDAVKDIIRKDTSDISYNMPAEILQELPFSSSFPHPLNFRYEDLGQDDIFIIEDPFSIIRGQPYIFQTARKNRPPALEYIHKYESLRDAYDYLLIEGESISLEAHAEDPDEDTVRYAFDGELGSNVGNSFSTLIPAAGHYTVTATATDEHLSDGQEIRVLADKKLESNFIINNGYADIPDNFVSLEDAFFLDASATNKTLDKYAEYTFTWSGLGTQAVQYACSVFPSYGRCELYNPMDISSIKDKLSGVDLGVRDVTLYTRLGYNGLEQTASASKSVVVTECLPHRNSADPFPYPYNQGQDPYQANHACCAADFTIAGRDTSCYTLEQCGHPKNTILYRRSRFCSGDRGNTCEGDWSADWEDLNQCGVNSQNSCSDVAEGCQQFTPYQTRPGEGWCNGPTGCEQLGCGNIYLPLVGRFEIGGIDVDGGALNSPNDYCGCTEADVDNQRQCIKDDGSSGVCTELGWINHCG